MAKKHKGAGTQGDGGLSTVAVGDAVAVGVDTSTAVDATTETFVQGRSIKSAGTIDQE